MANTEEKVRATLRTIDDLRRRADVAERMHTYWMGFDGGLTVKADVVVRRRWSNGATHSEIAMSPDEREHFRNYLSLEVGKLRARADDLAAALTTPKEPTDA